MLNKRIPTAYGKQNNILKNDYFLLLKICQGNFWRQNFSGLLKDNPRASSPYYFLDRNLQALIWATRILFTSICIIRI